MNSVWDLKSCLTAPCKWLINLSFQTLSFMPQSCRKTITTSRVETGILPTNYVNTMTSDTRAHCVTRSSATLVLIKPLSSINTLRPRQNGRHFADDTFKHIFLNENVRISIEISLKFVPKSPINNIPALVQIMAWRRSGDKPLPEPMIT